MSTTQKLRNFVDEPMGNKPVDSLAGIGEILGKRLKEKGYNKAYNVLGKFLYFDKDKDVFVRWLKISINANSEQGTDCFNCLNAWCDNHI